MDVNLLDQWAKGHGIRPIDPTEVTIPRVAEGRYRACLLDPALYRKVYGEGGTLAEISERSTRCAEGFLTPGGTLELALTGD
jgi:hypothetical protein